MGSLADHAYVIGDAEIDCLVFDTDNFTERARQLKAQYPDLTLLGFGPNDVGDDYLALADEFEPEPLVAPDVGLDDLCTDRLHRRHDRTPEGCADEPSRVAGDDVDPDGRVGVPRRPADRDRHAAVARRDVARRAGAAVGRSVLRDGVVQPGRLLRPGRRTSHHGDVDRPRHVVRTARASTLRDGRHVVDGDHLLRGVTDEPSQARPGDRATGARSSSSSTGRPRRRWSSPT